MKTEIEAGCLAITYNCKVKSNNGRLVIVSRFLGKVRGYNGDARWNTDKDFLSDYGESHNHVPESQLLRIGDPDLTLELEKEKELVK